MYVISCTQCDRKRQKFLFDINMNRSGGILWATIYGLSYYSVYSFPGSWFFAWVTIRVFTDIFPLLPQLQCSLVDKYAFTEFQSATIKVFTEIT